MKFPAFAFATALVLSACTPPQVDVKQRWSRAVISYSFVPVYPARSKLEIGEIRIHRIKGEGATLDSRLFFSAGDANLVRPEDIEGPHDALLPGIESLRVANFDGDGLISSRIFRAVFGTQAESRASLNISFGGLQTREVADREIIDAFEGLLYRDKDLTRFRKGLCASATTLGNAALDDIGISVVTRTIEATKVKYQDTRGFSTTNGGTTPPPEGTPVTNAGTDVIELSQATRLFLNENLPTNVVIGVDALTITPANLYGAKNLAAVCEGQTLVIRAQLDDLRSRLGVRAQ